MCEDCSYLSTGVFILFLEHGCFSNTEVRHTVFDHRAQSVEETRPKVDFFVVLSSYADSGSKTVPSGHQSMTKQKFMNTLTIGLFQVGSVRLSGYSPRYPPKRRLDVTGCG